MNITNLLITPQHLTRHLVKWSLLFAAGALLVGLPWIRWVQGRDVLQALVGSALPQGLLYGGGLGLLITGVVWPFFRHVPAGQAVLHRLNAMLDFQQLRVRDIMLIALSAGVGEEVLFRGVLQPHLGVWPTSILFGALHPLSWWYMLYGTGAGLLLGYLAIITEGLLAPIVCHTVVDGLLLWRARAWAKG